MSIETANRGNFDYTEFKNNDCYTTTLTKKYCGDTIVQCPVQTYTSLSLYVDLRWFPKLFNLVLS